MQVFILNLPKVELHLHIESLLEPELMFELAICPRVNIPFQSIDEVHRAYQVNNLQSFLDIYYQGANVLLTKVDIEIRDGILTICLPPPEIFAAALDDARSNVYGRDSGRLRRSNPHRDSQARQGAEREICMAALEDGFLELANAEAGVLLTHLLENLGFRDVKFRQQPP